MRAGYSRGVPLGFPGDSPEQGGRSGAGVRPSTWSDACQVRSMRPLGYDTVAVPHEMDGGGVVSSTAPPPGSLGSAAEAASPESPSRRWSGRAPECDPL